MGLRMKHFSITKVHEKIWFWYPKKERGGVRFKRGLGEKELGGVDLSEEGRKPGGGGREKGWYPNAQFDSFNTMQPFI